MSCVFMSYIYFRCVLINILEICIFDVPDFLLFLCMACLNILYTVAWIFILKTIGLSTLRDVPFVIFSLLFYTRPSSKMFVGLFTFGPFAPLIKPFYLIVRLVLELGPPDFDILAFFQSNYSRSTLHWSTYIISTSRSNDWDLITRWLDDLDSNGGFNEVNNHDLIRCWDGRSLFMIHDLFIDVTYKRIVLNEHKLKCTIEKE